jgi:hypothetical protein
VKILLIAMMAMIAMMLAGAPRPAGAQIELNPPKSASLITVDSVVSVCATRLLTRGSARSLRFRAATVRERMRNYL